MNRQVDPEGLEANDDDTGFADLLDTPVIEDSVEVASTGRISSARNAADDVVETDDYLVPRDQVPFGGDTGPTRFHFEVLTTEQMLMRPQQEFIVDGLIPQAGLAVLFGRGGVGKSFLALDWAACVSTGRTWFGQEVRRGAVVFTSLEGTPQARVRAWLSHKEVQHLPDLYWIDASLDLRNPIHRDGLIASVRSRNAHLLVIDTLARSIPGLDENSSNDMGVVVGFADDLRRETNSALLVIHHSGWKDENPRGHSSLFDGADTVLHLQGNGDIRTLKTTKQRNAEPGDEIRLQITGHEVAGSAVVTPVGPTDTLDQFTPKEKQLIECLVQRHDVPPARHNQLLQLSKDALDMADSTLNHLLKSLAGKDILAKTSEDKNAPYDWTQNGRNLVESLQHQ